MVTAGHCTERQSQVRFYYAQVPEILVCALTALSILIVSRRRVCLWFCQSFCHSVRVLEAQYLNNRARYIVGSYRLPIGNRTLRVQWSRDIWKPRNAHTMQFASQLVWYSYLIFDLYEIGYAIVFTCATLC